MHCCVCAGVCWHINGPYFCATHDPRGGLGYLPSTSSKRGWVCPRCRRCNAPFVFSCPCSPPVADLPDAPREKP